MYLPEQLYILGARDMAGVYLAEFVRRMNNAALANGGTLTINLPDGFAFVLDSLIANGLPGGAERIANIAIEAVYDTGELVVLARGQQTTAGIACTVRNACEVILGTRRGVTRSLRAVFDLNVGAVGTVDAVLDIHGWLIPQGNLVP